MKMRRKEEACQRRKEGRKEEWDEEEGWDNDRHCHAGRGARVYLRSGHAAASRKGSGGRAGARSARRSHPRRCRTWASST